MVNILENRNLRKNNILYWGRTRVTTLNNSVKPKRIRSISSVKKKHTTVEVRMLLHFATRWGLRKRPC